MWMDDTYCVGTYQSNRSLQTAIEINEWRGQALSEQLEGPQSSNPYTYQCQTACVLQLIKVF